MVSRCSPTLCSKVRDAIENICLFFLNILYGLNGRTRDEQRMWCNALIEFLLRPSPTLVQLDLGARLE